MLLKHSAKLFLCGALSTFAFFSQAIDQLSPIATMHHNAQIQSAKFSLTGQYIGTTSSDRTAAIWNALNITNASGVLVPEKIATVNHINTVNDISFATNRVATAGYDNVGKVWDLDSRIINSSGQPSLKFIAQLKSRTNSALHVIRFSPSQRMVATGSEKGQVVLYDLDKIQIREPESNYDEEHNYDYDGNDENYHYPLLEDNRTPYANIPEPDILARMWHSEPVIDIEFHPEKTLIATLATNPRENGSSLKLWDYSRLQRTNQGRIAPVLVASMTLYGRSEAKRNEVFFANDGESLIVSHGREVSVFNLDSIPSQSKRLEQLELLASIQVDSELIQSMQYNSELKPVGCFFK